MTVVPINAGRAVPDPRPMRASADAEGAFLGALLVQNDVYAHVAGFLAPDHFSQEINRRVFTSGRNDRFWPAGEPDHGSPIPRRT
jgi:DnaB-like helicase N terminal domain